MRFVPVAVALWILLAACDVQNSDPYEPVSADLSLVSSDASLDAAYVPTGAGQVGGDPITEKLCRWDACGGPLPDRVAPALDPR